MIVEIPKANFYKEIPSSWDQIRTREEYLKVVRHYLTFSQGKTDYDGFKLGLLTDLLGLKIRGELTVEASVNLTLMAREMEHYFEKEGKKIKPALYFTTNHLAWVRGRWFTRLYGPDELLADLSWFEFMHAMEAYQAGDVDLLAATLYRRRRMMLWFWRLLPAYDGRLRRKYNPVQRPLRSVGRLKPEVKEGIRLWFTATLQHITNVPLKVNGKDIALGVLFEGKEDDGVGMMGITYTLAETHIFGTTDQVLERNLYDVLLMMYNAKISQKKKPNNV